AAGWFSIWDVAVDPAWQGRRIGSKLMEEAVAFIREAGPGAIGYLFTFKHGFYGPLGFQVGGVSRRRLWISCWTLGGAYLSIRALQRFASIASRISLIRRA